MAFDKQKALAGEPVYWRGQKMFASPRYQPPTDGNYKIVRGGGDPKIDSEYFELKDFWILGGNKEFAIWDGNGVFKDTNCDAWGNLSTDDPIEYKPTTPEVSTVTSEESRKIGEVRKTLCWNPDCQDGKIHFSIPGLTPSNDFEVILCSSTMGCPTCFGKGYIELITY